MRHIESQPIPRIEPVIVRGRENAVFLQQDNIDPIIFEHPNGETVVLTKRPEIMHRIDASNKWLSGVSTPDEYGYQETTFTLPSEEVVNILNTPITIH